MRGVWISLRTVVLVFVLCATACGDDGGTPAGDAGVDAGPSGAVARFAPSDGAMSFGDVPFPHDLYVGGDGTIDLANLPIVGASTPALDALLEAVNAQTGSCTVCSTHFYVDGQLDPATVPAESASGTGDAIVMIDADPDSPERGRAIPLVVQWRPTAGLLTVRPEVGQHLRRSTTYAVALTDSLHAADGTALAPSASFAEARDGTEGEPAVVRAREVLSPALAELETAGLGRSRVVSLAVFTTEDPAVKTLALREAIHAAPVPAASVERVYPNATTTIDQLMGVPATAGFGLDIPEAGGAAGEIGIPHETVGQIVLGRLTASRVISGADGELGTLVRDAAGAPTVTGTIEIPFVLVVPAGADVSSLPVAVMAHGSPRTMADGLALADTVGTAGIAVLAFDQFEHGGRSPAAIDEHTIRGASGQDGFFELAEGDGAVPITRLAATRDVPPGMEAAVTYLEGAYGQIAADAFSIARWIAEGDLSAVAAADPALAGLAFDPDAVYCVANSFGTVAATVLAAIEPTIDAVVLNVPTGGFNELLAGSARNRTLVDTALLPILGIRGTVDEVSRRLLLEPMMDMLEWPLEWVDPRALTPAVYRDASVAGPRPDVLLQIAELDDYAPVSGGEGMAAALGAQGIGPFRDATSVEAATLPVSANLATPDGAAATAVAHVYEDAPHRMIGYNRDEIGFAEPIEPPFVALDEPRIVDAPTTASHLEIRRFFEAKLTTGRARVE